MFQPKEYHFHTGARFVYRMSGGFFLIMGLLFVGGKFTQSDPFKDPDIWFMLVVGSAFAIVGLRTILFGQWGRISLEDDVLKISTWIGRLTVKYSDVADIGLMVGSIPYRGIKAYLIRKRTGGMPVNLIIRDGGRTVKSSVVSSFENYVEIIEEIENRSGQPVKQISASVWHEWIKNPMLST
ncbi:MAG: hypothetical protein AAF902_26710 [Chloroflexota bacterium]